MQISRLFRIVYMLLEKKCVTAEEFAGYFEVSTRTIYRDVETLSASGIPIYMQKGKGGGISLLPDFVLNKTVLTQAEKDDIISSLQAMTHLTTGTADTALQKLGSMFGEQNANWLEIDFSDWKNHGTEMDLFETLKTAVIHKNLITFTYASNREESIKRSAEPLKLCFKAQAWYLYAYCRLRQDYRFFKLKRIRDLTVSGETFKRKPPETVLHTDDTCYEQQLVTMKLKISPEMAYRVYDEFDDYAVDDNGFFRCELTMPKGDWLFSYLSSYGDKCRVLEPSDIRDQLLAKLRKWEKSLDR